jgi:hypothetical protein
MPRVRDLLRRTIVAKAVLDGPGRFGREMIGDAPVGVSAVWRSTTDDDLAHVVDVT